MYGILSLLKKLEGIKMNDKKYLKLKECSEKKLKQIQGGNKSVIKGNPASNLAQCVFSFFKKC